jgi:hypothetical protein
MNITPRLRIWLVAYPESVWAVSSTEHCFSLSLGRFELILYRCLTLPYGKKGVARLRSNKREVGTSSAK